MSHPQPPPDPQIQALHAENQALRAELDRIHHKAEVKKQVRKRALGFGLRVLIPLLDRQKVVRSFSRFARTTARFTGPRDDWPTRDDVLGDARTFMESCVRFVIRRRTLLILFSIVASTVPAIQLWLVIQQNQIIENQNKFFEIQVYDLVGQGITKASEEDRNTRRMAGVLLANADIGFMQRVVEEVFDPELSGLVFSEQGARDRRLEDAVFRGHLIRAVARGVYQRGRKGMDKDELYSRAHPMFEAILADTVDRMPRTLRLGRSAEGVPSWLLEEADYYLYQVGYMLRVYGRLARAVGEEKRYFADIGPLLVRLTGRADVSTGRFAEVYRTAMQDFLIETALEAKLDHGGGSLEASGETIDVALRTGLERLRAGVEGEINWERLAQQVGVQ